MDPEQLAAAADQADEALAAQTNDYALQAAIAERRPDLHAALAANPASYSDLLAWLSKAKDPAVQAALEARGAASRGASSPQEAAADGRDDAEAAESAEVAEAVESAEPAESAESAEPAESPESVESAESAESTDVAEAVEGAVSDDVGAAQAARQEDEAPSAESGGAAGSARAAGAVETAETAETPETADQQPADAVEEDASEDEAATPDEPAPQDSAESAAPAEPAEPTAPSADAEPQTEAVPAIGAAPVGASVDARTGAVPVMGAASQAVPQGVPQVMSQGVPQAMPAPAAQFMPVQGQMLAAQPLPTPRRSKSRTMVVVLIVLGLLLIGGPGGWYLMRFFDTHSSVASTDTGKGGKSRLDKRKASPSASATSARTANYVTACGTAPTLTPTSLTNGDGELKVEVKMTASCADGDVLGGAANHIEVKGPSRTDGTGSADAVIASGDFDFSSSPLVLSDAETTLTLHFGSGHFFRAADDVDVKNVVAACAPDRDSGPSGATPDSTSSSGPSSATASTTSKDPASEESAAGGSLRWQVDHDRPSVTTDLVGKWVPQLSSKKPGLVADGITWDNRTTLEEFLKLRQKYSNAKLLFSDEWPVFDSGGSWWVTIVDTPYSSAEEANAWCDAQGFDAEHCFAKYIDTKGPSEGTTVTR
mgnify:CR=1 FL=1